MLKYSEERQHFVIESHPEIRLQRESDQHGQRQEGDLAMQQEILSEPELSKLV